MTLPPHGHHPPEPPSIAVAILQRLLADLPVTWRLSVEDSAMILIFDDTMQPRGVIDVASGAMRRIDLSSEAIT